MTNAQIVATRGPVDQLRKPFDDLARVLRARSAGRRAVFMIGDGNLGDGLIRVGAEHFLHDIGVDTQRLDMNTRRSKLRALTMGFSDPFGRRNLFIHNGGGGWAEHCSVAQRGVRLQMKACSDVIVLPSTFEVMPLRRRPTLFRRDHFGSRDVEPDAPFCHDMAFYLALIPVERWFPEIASVAVDTRLGVFFRTDNESGTPGGSPPGNLDISTLGTSVDDVSPLLRHVARCHAIVTDRLHVAIAASLLGKEVHLVSGRTWKIEAIYKSSIEPYFPLCRLVSIAEAFRRVEEVRGA